MTKDQFLSARFNNTLSLGLGVIVLSYVIFVIATASYGQQGRFLGVVLISSAFCIIVEGHTTWRFHRLKKLADRQPAAQAGCLISLFRLVYGAAWYLPVLLAFIGTISYSAGFAIFTAITLVRLIANLYINNRLDWEEFETFLFRS